jgi:hypothetical protein
MFFSYTHRAVTVTAKMNYLCEMCNSSFASKSTLKRHQIESCAARGVDDAKIKYNCEWCNISFARDYNLRRHVDSCRMVRAAADDAGPASKRPRLDGAAATSHGLQETETCGVCNVDVPKNHVWAHERSLEHRSKSCVVVSHGVQRIDSAFKNRIVSYRINGEKEHVDYSAFFDEIKSKVLSLLSEFTRLHKSIKVNMVAIGRYFLPTQETFSEKSFNTPNKIVTMGCDLNDVYQSFVEMMKVQAADFQEKDSGMFENVKSNSTN